MSQESRDKSKEMSKELATKVEVDPKQVPPQAGSSQPATAPTQSRLGRLTSALISKMLVPKEFENLISSGAISINNEKLPIHLLPTDGSDEPSGYTLSSVLGKLIASNPGLSGDLADYTISDLQNAVQQAMEEKYKDPSTLHFTKPPSKFGSEVISEDDIARLSQLRKLDNNRENVVRIMDSCSMFHTMSGSKFSKPEFLRLVKLSLPNRAHETCDAICTSSNNDPVEVYRILSLRFDNRKSRDQVIHELQGLHSADLSLMEAFERIYDLVINLRDKSVSIDNRGYEEGMRLLRARVNPTTFATIRTLLREHKNPESFYTLYSVCKDYFGQDPSLIYRPSVLNGQPVQGIQVPPVQAVQQTQVNSSNNVDPGMPDVTQSDLNTLKHEIVKLKEAVKNLLNANQNEETDEESESESECDQISESNTGAGLGQGRVICHSCEQSRPVNYAKSSCVLHTNGKHTNQACRNQRSPCQFAPHHNSHTAGECRRPLNAKPASEPQIPQQGGVQNVMSYPFAQAYSNMPYGQVPFMPGHPGMHGGSVQPAIHLSSGAMGAIPNPLTQVAHPMIQQATSQFRQPDVTDVDRLRDRLRSVLNE